MLRSRSIVEHTLLTSVYAIDLMVFPAHWFHDSSSLYIYELGFPLFPYGRGPNADLLQQGVGDMGFVTMAVAAPIFLALFMSTLTGGLF